MIRLEKKTILKFADDIEDILFSDTYVKEFAPSEAGATGGKQNKILFNESFPVEYHSEDGHTYYGLVRAPSGIVTWSGEKARKAAAADSRYRIPIKMPMLKQNYKLLKNSEIKKLIDDKILKFKDDDNTKAKVVDLYKKYNASINDRGDIKGLNKVLKNVGFWKDIKALF